MGCLFSNVRVKPDDPSNLSPAGPNVKEPTPDPSSMLRLHLDLSVPNKNEVTVPSPLVIGSKLSSPPGNIAAKETLDRIQGSLFGLVIGDALGAHVEFRPRAYMLENPVKDLEGGGTWGLQKGEFTDDTSMALCLAASLIVHGDFVPYDQLVRYKWWFKHGYMSSTGTCFDIGAATRDAVDEFEKRQRGFCRKHNLHEDKMDNVSDVPNLSQFDCSCGNKDAAGNGSLMRLAPVPLFFYEEPKLAVKYSGESSDTTHGDQQAHDACRFYGALIVGAIRGLSKDKLLSSKFYKENSEWFGEKLHPKIEMIAQGSYKQKTPDNQDDPIRGRGYVVNSLEAALWAFHNDNNSFEQGALLAVNLGDDTDTTAAIYGQLAGAYYGYENLPKRWVEKIYASQLIERLSEWIFYRGKQWSMSKKSKQ